jgi:hypothetical protein
MDASLVMRDRETDSWWSIMTSDSIGGKMEGVDLVELPYGEKSTWKDWVARYPDTRVLSVGGVEHIENNPYDNYFSSDETFRDLKITDHRLEPKEAIFTFWVGDQPWAVPHVAYEGGRLFEVEGLAGQQLLLYRSPGASLFESTKAYLIAADKAADADAAELLARAEASGSDGLETVTGFDTFWYNWIAVNESSKLLQ